MSLALKQHVCRNCAVFKFFARYCTHAGCSDINQPLYASDTRLLQRSIKQKLSWGSTKVQTKAMEKLAKIKGEYCTTSTRNHQRLCDWVGSKVCK